MLGSTDDIVQHLYENSIQLQQILMSEHVGPFLTNVQNWEKCLNMVTEIVDEWISLQKKWLYLKELFATEEIKNEMADDVKRFNEIDKNFKKVGFY